MYNCYRLLKSIKITLKHTYKNYVEKKNFDRSIKLNDPFNKILEQNEQNLVHVYVQFVIFS